MPTTTRYAGDSGGPFRTLPPVTCKCRDMGWLGSPGAGKTHRSPHPIVERLWRSLSSAARAAGAKLAAVTAPARRSVCIDAARNVESAGFADHAHITPATESCEHHIRRRRTYREVKGTAGYDIIAEAGLPPFPELTERQQEIVASRARQKKEEARTMERFGAEAARSTQRARL